MQAVPTTQCAPLSAIQRHLRVGHPLPVNVRNRDGTLLLACGQVISSAAQLQALLEHGALVDTHELQILGISAEDVRTAPRDQLVRLWAVCFDRLRQAIQDSPPDQLAATLEQATQPVIALVERDPDLAIFQMLRNDSLDRRYGMTRSLHAATATYLACNTLQWTPQDAHRIFKAALTMNISMLDLQSQLAMQLTAPTPSQREAIHTHPTRSRVMLEHAGITDRDWLDAVSQHHENPNGAGYPTGCTAIHEWAILLAVADNYTSMLSTRATRDAMPADEAARLLYRNNPGNPMAAALIKAFGIYPPGTHVRLACGEIAMAIERGPAANTPVVLALTNAKGEPLVRPLRRSTSERLHAIVGVLSAKQVRVRVPPEGLIQMAYG